MDPKGFNSLREVDAVSQLDLSAAVERDAPRQRGVDDPSLKKVVVDRPTLAG